MIGVALWMTLAGVAGAPEPDVVARTPRPHTVFLDFAGGPITAGDDTTAGEAVCIEGQLYYPPFLGDGDVAEAALAEARAILAPYAVHVTATRPPASLEYTWVRIGADPELFGLEEQLNGLSCRGIDCGDAAASDTAFVFADKFAPTASGILDDAEARGVAIGRIAVHEAAHTWGLEHAGASESIMSTFPSGADTQTFVIGCIDLDVPAGAKCPEQHLSACPDGRQDAHVEMRLRFGLASKDTTPPTVSIVSPSAGDTFVPGDEITLEVEAADDLDAVGWSLRVPELDYDWVAPPHVRVRDLVLPAGTLTFEVEAIDPAGNAATASVIVHVVEPVDEMETVDAASAACACRSAGGAGGVGLVTLLCLVFGRRRRDTVGAR